MVRSLAVGGTSHRTSFAQSWISGADTLVGSCTLLFPNLLTDTKASLGGALDCESELVSVGVVISVDTLQDSGEIGVEELERVVEDSEEGKRDEWREGGIDGALNKLSELEVEHT